MLPPNPPPILRCQVNERMLETRGGAEDAGEELAPEDEGSDASSEEEESD